MEITFLGTSSMQPIKERNPSAVLLTYKGRGILFDCAEGTQRQMKIAGISLTNINVILISHWHGDHVLGLPGLIQSLQANQYTETLQIYGPKGTKERFASLMNAIVMDLRMNIEVTEVESGVFYENSEIKIQAEPLKHNTPCIGFRVVEKDRRRIDLEKAKNIGIPEGPLLGKLQRGEMIEIEGKKINPDDCTYVVKGKKVAYVVDTAPNDNIQKLAQDADLLICEATFGKELQDKAEAYFHMSAADAAQAAKDADVKKLVLTHFSARYNKTDELVKDAREIHDNVEAAKDFLNISV